jgi:hypothetical protein
MANGEERGTAAEQRTRILGESGLEKRGGYSAMEPPKPLPKVQSGPAAGGATTGSQQVRHPPEVAKGRAARLRKGHESPGR